MARTSETMSIYEAKNMLEERLTCPGCSNILVEPRVLSCMHSFCFNCIQGMEIEGTGEETERGEEEDTVAATSTAPVIRCPVCEIATDYPADGGAAALSPAFHLIAMLELYKMVYKVQKGDKKSCENCKENCAVGYCKHCSQLLCRGCISIHHRWSQFEKHEILGIDQIANTALQGLPLKDPSEMKCSEHDEPMLFICNTCDHVICCQSCTVREHKEHDFQLVSEDFPRHEEDIRNALQPIKDEVERIKSAMADITLKENEIMQNGNEVMEHTRVASESVLQAVKEAEEQFYTGTQALVHTKLETLSQQRMELQAVLDDLTRCEAHVEDELRVASSQQILTKKNQMIDTISKVGNKSVIDDVSPREFGNICSAPKDDILEKCQDMAKVDGAEIAGIQVLNRSSVVGALGKEVCFDIKVKTSPLGFLIEPSTIVCSFSCAADGQECIECTVDEIAPAKYRVTYTPPDTSTRQLKVDIDDVMHFDVPFTVRIAHVPELKGRLKSELMKPWGVCFTKTGQIIATDFEAHQVKIFNSRGDHLNTIGQRGKGKGQFKSPAGVAINSKNQIVVVESENHRIQVISDHGDFIKCIGEKGDGVLQFAFPYDVAVSRSGMIFVSDTYNHRIQVLNPDLTFAGVFGSEGSHPGQFKGPIGIAIDSAEQLYIADSGNERIQVFTVAGDFVREFGKEELTIPSGVAVDSNDVVFVSDTGIGEVVFFNTSGDFLGNYAGKSDELSKPTGITVGNGDVLYVCDWGVNDILTLY